MFENTSDPMPKTLSPWWWPKHHLFRQARKIMENSMEDSWKKHGKSWENLMTSLFFSEFLCSHKKLFFGKLSAADIISTVRTLWRLLEVAPKKMYELLQKKSRYRSISVKQTLIMIIRHKVSTPQVPPQKKDIPKSSKLLRFPSKDAWDVLWELAAHAWKMCAVTKPPKMVVLEGIWVNGHREYGDFQNEMIGI